MNKTEVVFKVSERSGVNEEDCRKVLDALEEVLSDELSNSQDVRSVFDKVYSLLHFFQKNKS
ncbi:HU family DNA-binding protein [Brevibacillus ruminantium]|uniref:HU family DNA-binding protein n=1 Tax=Brevibacillus ruminantium TaxID=2950604 RepID=A0ABY4WCA5_9BACL|nr:HU family DNA-binding protein [Brevibacillus ruminantium]USG64800.1 HU family DNA-binding protein [Brevibacillus ruminantium]